MKRVLSKSLLLLALVLLVLLAGCATSSGQLRNAQRSYQEGNYVEAIEFAVRSYELAVEKNKKPEEITEAKNFLLQVFPEGNNAYVQQAEALENGNKQEKVTAWEIWEKAVKINSIVGHSVANAFLDVTDYSNELSAAKELAASVYYEAAIGKMEKNTRADYIAAYSLLSSAQSLVPQYKDSVTLQGTCMEEALIIIAFINSNEQKLIVETEKQIPNLSIDFNSVIPEMVKRKLIANDNADFLLFRDVSSIQEAKNIGAHISVKVDGEIFIRSNFEDSSRGIYVMHRDYNAQTHIRYTDLRNNEEAYTFLIAFIDQDIHIDVNKNFREEFEMPQDLYYRMNNIDLNTSLKEEGLSNLKNQWDARVYIDLYGGYEEGEFYYWETATVKDLGELPQDLMAYNPIHQFLVKMQSEFFTFQDISLLPIDEVIADELEEQFNNGEKDGLLDLLKTF